MTTEMAADTHQDEALMQRALELAAQARYLAPPNPAVGCVIATDDGRVIGEGFTREVGGPHAEIVALDDVANRGLDANGATAYVTLEPCCHHGRTPPCTDRLVQAGVKRVVVASCDPDPRVNGQGLQTLVDAGITVEHGLCVEQADEINRAFFHRIQTGRPWVRIKLASSMDGRTAMQSGESMWITGTDARHDVQFLRAESDCILTGSGTVLQDDPSLDVRLTADELGLPPQAQGVRQPLRVVVDSVLRLGADRRMLATGGDIRIYTDGVEPDKNTALATQPERRVEIIPGLGTAGSGISLEALLEDLALLPVNLVHVEAGATLCGALLSGGLADEIVLYLAPHVMGNQGKPQFILPELHKMDQRVALTLHSHDKVGNDLRLIYRVGEND